LDNKTATVWCISRNKKFGYQRDKMYGHGNGAGSMSMEEVKMKLCAQARLLGRECNPSVMVDGTAITHLSRGHHYQSGDHDDVIAQQSKDAIIYVTIVVVFYVGIVVLLIGTNLRAGGAGRGARFKKHVVDYTEGTGAESRLVPTTASSPNTSPRTSSNGHHPSCKAANTAIELAEDDIAEV